MFTCISCSKKLEDALGGGTNPSNGVFFTSYGNYGSTVFDEMSGNFLRIVICDKCLIVSSQHKLIDKGKPRRTIQETDYETWNY